MDLPFQFDGYASGKHFIGRRQDCEKVAGLVSAGRHVAMWAPPKSGKMSVVLNAVKSVQSSGRNVIVCSMSCAAVHEAGRFVRLFAGAVVSASGMTASEVRAAGLYDPDRLSFDPFGYTGQPGNVEESCDVTDSDVETVMEMPFRLAEFRHGDVIVIISEFQNILSCEGEKVFRIMEKILPSHSGDMYRCPFVLTGSKVNAMEYIFRRRYFFWNIAEQVSLSPVPDSEVVEYVLRGFNSGGKVIDRELIQKACIIFRNNLWLVNRFFFICDSLSKGYISEITCADAMSCLIASSTPAFMSVMNDLTCYQERLVKSLIDGNMKFSAREVIAAYRLSSSANVTRLKEALMKKEIIMFNGKGEPLLQDPLLEYWLRKYYFKVK